MPSVYRIVRNDGEVIVSGYDATNATGTVEDAPPAAGTWTYTLEAQSSDGTVTRIASRISVTKMQT